VRSNSLKRSRKSVEPATPLLENKPRGNAEKSTGLPRDFQGVTPILPQGYPGGAKLVSKRSALWSCNLSANETPSATQPSDLWFAWTSSQPETHGPSFLGTTSSRAVSTFGPSFAMENERWGIASQCTSSVMPFVMARDSRCSRRGVSCSNETGKLALHRSFPTHLRTNVDFEDEGAVDWASLGNLEELRALLFRSLPCKFEVAVNAIQHSLFGFTISTVGCVNPVVARTNGDCVKRPALASRIQRNSHRVQEPRAARIKSEGVGPFDRRQRSREQQCSPVWNSCADREVIVRSFQRRTIPAFSTMRRITADTQPCRA
jgi:hypothetical protein